MDHAKRHRIHTTIRQRARELRRAQTPAETKLWRVLHNHQLGGYKFRRQHPVGRFIVDFYCTQAKLVVEIDGDVHADQIDYDKARTQWLNEHDYTVLLEMKPTHMVCYLKDKI